MRRLTHLWEAARALLRLQKPSPRIDSIKVSDVFKPTGIPTHTLIDRSHTAAYQEIQFRLSAGGLVSVYGDSTSGKTVLCLTILEESAPILLHGPHIQNEAGFWSILRDKLGLGEHHTITRHTTETGKSEASAKVSIGVGQAKFARENETTHGTEVRDQFSPGSHDAIECLIKSRRPIVIDDFHAVPRAVQTSIVYKLKPAIDHGVPVVVVSIPEQTEDIIQGLSGRGEIARRHAKVEAPLWEPVEIKQIPLKGFRVLNVTIDEKTIDTLTKHSYRNPLLMQAYCQRLCFKLRITERLPTHRAFEVADAIASKVLEDVASEYAPAYSDYLRLNKESQVTWPLKSRKAVSIYLLIVLALARIPINYPVKVRTIRDRIRDELKDGALSPNEATIHNALCKITEETAGKEDDQAPLRYDRQKRYAFVTHPFLKVFLLWGVLPKYR